MALDLDRIRGLCFDVDGTLRDTDNDLVERVGTWIRPLGLIITQNRIHSLSRRMVMAIETPGNTVQTLLDRLGLDTYLDALSNPEDTDYELTRVWMDDEFDSEAFDLDAVNQKLARVR